MVEPLRHRQTKGAGTDMCYLKPPRHISTLPFASVWPDHGDFRSTLVTGHSQNRRTYLKGAKGGSRENYSITSSAISNTRSGMVRPSALAVRRLIMNSNVVGCSTGRSAGFAPLKMRSTYC